MTKENTLGKLVIHAEYALPKGDEKGGRRVLVRTKEVVTKAEAAEYFEEFKRLNGNGMTGIWAPYPEHLD
jgi:hypothetical protein